MDSKRIVFFAGFEFWKDDLMCGVFYEYGFFVWGMREAR
jgi:hypothetical protein